jgi:hypothetical protein
MDEMFSYVVIIKALYVVAAFREITNNSNFLFLKFHLHFFKETRLPQCCERMKKQDISFSAKATEYSCKVAQFILELISIDIDCL